MPERILIVNADDFGQSIGVNRGILEAHEHGIVTSASLMVRWPAAKEAAEYARSHHSLSIGLHLDLGEWSYQQDRWQARYEVVPLDDETAISAEINHQISDFRTLVGRDPSHIDSHQHVHREQPVRRAASKLAHELGIPIRHLNSQIRYCGSFYGRTKTGQTLRDAISADALLRILQSLKPGITELACHPGYGEEIASDYSIERMWEIVSLCNPAVKAMLVSENIELRSFASPEVTQLIRCPVLGEVACE